MKKHFFSRSYASHQRKILKPEKFRQGMSYIENSTLGLTVVLFEQIWVLRKLANSHFCSDS